LKDLRNRINKKIRKNYNQRQKIISDIKQALDIDFNKISVYSSEIKIFPDSKEAKNVPEVDLVNKPKSSVNLGSKEVEVVTTKPLFRVEVPDSIIGSQRYFYKGVEMNSLPLEELGNLKKDLDYILKELEIEIDKVLS
jgi:hypothetical protein